MKICIPGSVLGRQESILVQHEDVCIVDQIPKDAWVIGNHPNFLSPSEILDIFNIENISTCLYTDSEAKSFEILGKDPKEVPWYHVLGSSEIKSRIGKISSALNKAFERPDLKSYKDIYVGTKSLLRSLSPALINIEELKSSLTKEKNPSIKTTLRSFIPTSKGESLPPLYSQTSTSTGRLTVKSGPSILTLPSKHRKILRSRYENGSIVCVDFKSLEPRVALSVIGKEAPEDIYTFIASSILEQKSERSIAKIATIAALYGISFRKFQEMSGCKDRYVLEKVKEYFEVKRLSKQLEGNNFLNYFGRMLDSQTLPHVRVSHFVQSTSCDVVNIAFWNLVKDIKSRSLKIKPIYVLHDALILDSSSQDLAELKDMCSNGLETLLGKFPVEVSKF